MSWDPQRRWPTNWTTIRAAVLARDGRRCQLAGPGCIAVATEVDHIGDRNDHRTANLQAVCAPCHAAKTQAEAHAYQSRRHRPPEPHPGGGPL